MDIQIIREAYPTPMMGLGRGAYPEGSYCIGGALCAFYELTRELALTDLFPDRFTLADALQLINPRLPMLLAMELAQDIIRDNDEGTFEQAWIWAGYAVNYVP